MLDTILDQYPTSEYGACVAKRPDIPAPKLRYEAHDIKGRHGSLIEEDAFDDIEFSVEYNMLEDFNVKPLIRQLRGYFFGKKTLRFSDDDVFYKIKHISIDETDNQIAEYGYFTVTFRCDPFTYNLNSEFEIMTSGQTILNRGTFASEPYIKVNGSGDITLTINNDNIYLYNVVGYVEIDSQDEEYHKDFLPIENGMAGEFPMFEVGDNTISWTGSVTSLEIDGRWRFI